MQKRLINFGFCLMFLALSSNAISQNTFTQKVNQLWEEGKKSEVHEIALKRLKDNPKDVIALLLKLDYEMNQYDVESMRETIKILIPIIEKISTPNFVKQKKLLRADLIVIQESLNVITPEIIQAEKNKVYPGKPLNFKYAIEALEKDELIMPLKSSESVLTIWQNYRWIFVACGLVVIILLAILFFRKKV